MDGLIRRLTSFSIIPEKVNLKKGHSSNEEEIMREEKKLQAYVVGGRDVLRTWERNRSPVVVMLPGFFMALFEFVKSISVSFLCLLLSPSL